jgi:hypothetical protein
VTGQDQLATVLRTLRAKLPPGVRHGLTHNLVSLFTVAQLATRRARAAGITVPGDLLATSDDPAVTVRAIAGHAANTSPGWADDVRATVRTAADEPLLGIGVIYPTQQQATDRTRIAFADIGGTGYLLHDDVCTTYPVGEPPDLDDLDRESGWMYLSTLILATLIYENEANRRAHLTHIAKFRRNRRRTSRPTAP